MQMTTIIYLAFLLAIFLLLVLCNKLINDKNNQIYKLILLAASYIFILYADYRYLLIIIALSICVYVFQHKNQDIGIVISLLLLGICKYFNFFIESFSKLVKINATSLKIILPLGISFYTFSAISYLVDSKRKKIEKNSLIDISLYLSFFPKLTSGPIQRFDDFKENINKKKEFSLQKLFIGLQIVLLGVFKKIVLADRLSVFTSQVFNTPKVFSSFTLILAAVSYSLQIYFDFSGYSDIAIGSAKILDIDLPRNFNLPYLSCNVTEFWKRWHITLSTWLLDYLYIGLGGNRKGKLRQYINLFLTMLIGGLWHGANWTFIVWGALNGISLIVHKIWMNLTKSNKKDHSILYSITSQIVTFIFITITWVYFNSNTISKANDYLLRMISFKSGVNQPYFWSFISIVIYIVFTASQCIKQKDNIYDKNKCKVDYSYPALNLNNFKDLVLFFVFCGLLLCLAYTGSSPFIYGNF